MAKHIQLGVPVTAGESKMLGHLEKMLPDYFILLGNPLINLGQTTRELDAVLISPYGEVFVIDSKDLHGCITGDEDTWVVGRDKISGVINKAIHNAAILKGKIVKRFPRLIAIRVDPVILLTNEKASLNISDARVPEMTVKLSEARDFFLSRKNSRRIPSKDVQDIVRGIVGDVAYPEIEEKLLAPNPPFGIEHARMSDPMSENIAYVRLTGSNGFSRTYYETCELCKSELRGVENWKLLSGCRLLLRFISDRVEVLPVSGAISVDSKLIAEPTYLQEAKFVLGIGDVRLEAEIVRTTGNFSSMIGLADFVSRTGSSTN